MRLTPASIRKLIDQRTKSGRRATAEEAAEWRLCSRAAGTAGFVRFCERWVRIVDRATKREIPFQLFPGQMRIVDDLVAGRWLLILKSRQVGFTWMFAAYVIWRMTFEPVFTAAVINQEKDYAQDFLRRLRWIHAKLPPWLRVTMTTDNTERIECHAGSHYTDCRVYASSAKAARSVTGDLIIWDEADYHDYLAESLAAGKPALEVAKGQGIINSTAAKTGGEFHDIWNATYGLMGTLVDAETGLGPTGFIPRFIHWSERPGRDQAWYDQESERLFALTGSRITVKREYPNDPEEAFEFAAGRVLPYFTVQSHVGRMEIPKGTDRYRAIDWGETESPYVVLFVAHFPGPPGLLVSPDCPNCIRQFLAWRRDEDTAEPLDEDDDCPDALRYLVTTLQLGGLVYVYREIYREQSLDKGWTPMKEIEEIHRLSGWRRSGPYSRRKWVPEPHAEVFVATVADSAMGKLIALWNEHEIPTRPAKKLGITTKGKFVGDRPLSTRDYGIRYLSALIDGTRAIHEVYQVEPAVVEAQKVMEHDRRGRQVGATRTAEASWKADMAAELLRARAAQR